MLKPNKQAKANSKKLKALIIGAGRIASGFDNLSSKQILTHAHAYKINPQTQLIGFYDLNFKVAKLAAKKWGVSAFKSVTEAFKHQPDIISICVSGDHYPVLKEVIKYKPRLIICEKPVTASSKKTKEIISLANKAKIQILVNYSRTFDPAMQTLAKDLKSGKYGQVLSASAIYTKGILHNGSHMVDLARFMFGDLISAKKLNSKIDFKKEDPTVSAYLKFKNCPEFYLRAGDETKFSIFELDILTAKARLSIVDSGFSLVKQTVKEDKMYKGYKKLVKDCVIKTQLDKAMANLVNNGVRYLDDKTPLLCNINEALKTQEGCEKVKNG